MRILTIGAYGYNEASFISAIKSAGVDTFIDTRQRRAMRGRAYAFANAKRLQDIVHAAGIRYVYVQALAPTTEIRAAQKASDASAGIAKRDRAQLSEEFSRAYRDLVLARFDTEAFARELGSASTLVLFCVEKLPTACHRSLAAEFLGHKLAAEVQHLLP